MPMSVEEGEILRREIDGFTLTPNRKRVEFSLPNWQVTMYRIEGQVGLIRVDLHEKVRDRRIHPPAYEQEVEVVA